MRNIGLVQQKKKILFWSVVDWGFEHVVGFDFRCYLRIAQSTKTSYTIFVKIDAYVFIKLFWSYKCYEKRCVNPFELLDQGMGLYM